MIVHELRVLATTPEVSGGVSGRLTMIVYLLGFVLLFQG